MNRTKKAGLSVKSGLSLMCIVCLLCGSLCGFFWLAGENSVLAAGPDGSALAAKAVVSGDASLAAPERGENLVMRQRRAVTVPVTVGAVIGQRIRIAEDITHVAKGDALLAQRGEQTVEIAL